MNSVLWLLDYNFSCRPTWAISHLLSCGILSVGLTISPLSFSHGCYSDQNFKTHGKVNNVHTLNSWVIHSLYCEQTENSIKRWYESERPMASSSSAFLCSYKVCLECQCHCHTNRLESALSQ